MNYLYTSPIAKPIPIPDTIDVDDNASYYKKYQIEIINDNPGTFIFLIDQSGSMLGNPILLVKEAFFLFIQSLPPKSFVQLIGFGSSFKPHQESPVQYNKKNIAQITKTIRSLVANMKETNLCSPLQYICEKKDNIITNYKYPNLFILTDGCVINKQECLKIIAEASNWMRVHSIGIGNTFDLELIEKSGKLGKGSYSYARNLGAMKEVVIEALNKSLRNSLLSNQFDFSGNIGKMEYFYSPNTNVIYQDDLLCYSFITKGHIEKTNINIKITSNTSFGDIVAKDIAIEKETQIEKGDTISKIIMGQLINGFIEAQEIQIAKDYQILSKNTAFFGEIKNENSVEGDLTKVDLTTNIYQEVKMQLNQTQRIFSDLVLLPHFSR